MNRFVRMIAALLSAGMCLAAVAGCSDGGQDVAADLKIDKLLGYTPSVHIETAMSYYVSSSLPEGQTEDDNLWTRLYAERGIDIKYRFTAPNNQYTEKLNADIATANIPDMFTVDINQLAKLIKAGLIYDDLTQVFEQYATEDTKRLTGGLGSEAFRKVTVDGKLRAIPWTDNDYDSSEIMYIRKDWLDKLGLKAPETIDELEAVLEAFVRRDPDGNGENDTVGLVGNKDLFKSAASFSGIFNAYGAYPDIWIDDAKNPGKITYGYFAPEMKAPLQKLTDWYKKGLVYEEFAVKDASKAAGMVQSGRAGVWFANMANPLWPLSTTKANDFNADWLALPVPTAEKGKPAKTSLNAAAFRYHVVSKKCKTPEALVIMMNNFIDKLWGENNEFDKYHEVHAFALFQAWPEKKNLDCYHAVTEAIDKKDPSKLNTEQRNYYDNVKAYIDRGNKITDVTQVDNWSFYRIFYTGGSQWVIDNYIKSGNFIKTKWNRLDTPTMVMKQKSIDSKMKEIITKVIIGRASLAEFDQTVESVLNMGARDIIREANEAVAK